jgi:hypothetical protein
LWPRFFYFVPKTAQCWHFTGLRCAAFFCTIKEKGAVQMAYRQINLNPEQKRVGDCTVRAIAAATDQEWEAVYAALVLAGFELHDMPSANYVWGHYLRRCGWNRSAIPNSCPDCYTVAQFAKDHPDGTYILAMATHVVCVQNGDWLDTWDSGDEVPLYYWQKG